ncbi:hypothetical protein ACS0TY_007477 [Phlomoides rotata]
MWSYDDDVGGIFPAVNRDGPFFMNPLGFLPFQDISHWSVKMTHRAMWTKSGDSSYLAGIRSHVTHTLLKRRSFGHFSAIWDDISEI